MLSDEWKWNASWSCRLGIIQITANIFSQVLKATLILVMFDINGPNPRYLVLKLSKLREITTTIKVFFIYVVFWSKFVFLLKNRHKYENGGPKLGKNFQVENTKAQKKFLMYS